MNRFLYAGFPLALLIVNCLGDCKLAAAMPTAIATLSQGTSDQGGGGDLAVEDRLSIEEISSVIHDLRTTIPPVLFRMEAYGVTYEQALKVAKEKKQPQPELLAHHLVNVLAKIFKNKGDAVYDVLKTVRFVAHLDGPCHDLRSEDKDGSAFNIDSTELCLSVPRLQKKVTHLTEQSEILALAFHELSHRLGADEDEARAVQFMVLQQFGSATPESFSNAFGAILDSPHWDLNALRKVLLSRKAENLPAICLAIGENFRDLSRLMQKKGADAQALGILFERPKTMRALLAAREQSAELLGFCTELYHDTYTVSDAGFDPNGSFPISALETVSQVKSPTTLRSEDGLVKFVNPGDWDAALFVYDQIDKNHQLYDELRKQELADRSQ